MADDNEKTIMVQGRIVWRVGADLFKPRPSVDQQTKAPRMGKDGQQMMQYGFGLAVPKSVLNQCGPGQPGEIWSAIHEVAWTLYPSRQLPPSFAMKYKDGDGIDDQGQPFSLRKGYAGHLVFACTTSLPIKWFKFENGMNVLINEGVKCGDYVNVQLTIKAHPAAGTAKAGLYLNPNAVQFLGFGEEIINTPSGDQIFGVAAPAIPAGASATPFAPQPGQMLVPPPGQQPYGGTPQFAQPGQPVQQYPQQAPAMPQQVQQGAPIQANYAVIPQPLQPPQYQQPAPIPQSTPIPQQYQQPQAPAMPGVPGVPRF